MIFPRMNDPSHRNAMSVIKGIAHRKLNRGLGDSIGRILSLGLSFVLISILVNGGDARSVDSVYYPPPSFAFYQLSVGRHHYQDIPQTSIEVCKCQHDVRYIHLSKIPFRRVAAFSVGVAFAFARGSPIFIATSTSFLFFFDRPGGL